METGFTLDYFVEHINSLISSVKKEYKVKYNFDSSHVLTECSINEEKRKMTIGINGLPGIKTNYRGLLKFKPSDVSDDFIVEPHIFTACTVGVFHEIGHLNQYVDDIQTEADLAYNDISGYSDLYYYNPRNYAYNPREILAEYDGIMSTYEYFSKHSVGDEVNLIVDYVNSRVNFYREGYFIHRNVTSMDDIETAFDEAFDNSKLYKRVFSIYKKGLSNDEVLNFFDEQPRFRVKFDEEQDPVQQDKMIASVVLHDRPEIQANYQCLKDVDMSVENVFGIPLRELPDICVSEDEPDDFECDDFQ